MNNANSLKKIIDDFNLTQSQLAKKLGYSESHINKIIKGKSPLTKSVKDSIYKEFKYDIDKSNEPKDEAVIFYEYFEEIFKEIDTVEANSNSNDDERDNFLFLKMNKHLYDFFINVNSVKKLKEYDTSYFEAEFDKFRKEYRNSKEEFQEYLLIPCKSAYEIVGHVKQKEKILLDKIDSDILAGYCEDLEKMKKEK